MGKNSKIEYLELKNGIRVILVPLLGLRAVTIEVFCKIGSKYERTSEHGLSHFLEHMAFKGTPKRPTAEMITREIDARGASYNAETGQETTSYYITTVAENMDWAMGMLTDIVFEAKLEGKEVLKERGVIASEIKMYKENPTMGLASDFAKFLYGESKIGCFDIAGEVEEVLGYKRQNVVDFRGKYLNPKEMVVVIAGNIGDLKIETDKYFGGFENDEAVALPKVEIEMTEKKIMKVVKKETEQGHFCIGGEGVPRDDPRKYAYRLLEVILAGNTSSRLHYELREKRGWTYYIYLVGESWQEAGFWGVQSGVENDKMDKARDVVVKEVLSMGKDGVTSEELVRAKAYILGRTELLMDRSGFWSEMVGRRMLLEGKLIDMDEELRKYQKVTLEDVGKLTGEIFVEKKLRSLIVSRS